MENDVDRLLRPQRREGVREVLAGEGNCGRAHPVDGSETPPERLSRDEIIGRTVTGSEFAPLQQ